MDIRVTMRQDPGGQWLAGSEGEPSVGGSGATRERCLASFRRALDRSMRAPRRGDPMTLVVEFVPKLAGVAEAARITGWDKRRVITYIDRGSFPEPVQSLASGRVWIESDVERFARDWRAKQVRRRRRAEKRKSAP